MLIPKTFATSLKLHVFVFVARISLSANEFAFLMESKSGSVLLVDFRHGIFPFFNGNPFFSGPFGSFLRSMQIRFNIYRGGGGVMRLFNKYMVCLTVNPSVI